MSRALAAEQLHKALQLFVQTLDDDNALEVATVFPEYEIGRAYEKDFIFSYGENSTGDPQLYRRQTGSLMRLQRCILRSA